MPSKAVAKRKPKAPAKKKKVGAPSKIDEKRMVEVKPNVVEEMTAGDHVCWIIETTGAFLRDAAAAAGISERAVHGWRSRGEEWLEQADEAGEAIEVPESEVPFVQFAQALQKARGQATVYHLSNIRRHALVNWTASAWYLERTQPEVYGKRSRHEHSGPDGKPIEHEVFVPPSDEWHEKVTEVAAEAERQSPK